MKAIFLALLLSTVSVLSAPPFQSVTWAVMWPPPTNAPILSSYVPATNSAYKLYGTSTLGTPMAQWPLLTLWTNWAIITNADSSIVFSNNITLPFANQYFFTINPTNYGWSEPPFSLNYWATAMSGPVWSTINNSSLIRQGP